jgi:hypothetical protein
MFWWMPEIKQGYYVPEWFVMFRPANNAGVGFSMWYVPRLQGKRL